MLFLFDIRDTKNGRSIDGELKNYVGEEVYKFDATVFDELDSLHDSVGPIKKLRNLWLRRMELNIFSFWLTTVLSKIIISGVWPIWI
jgi:arginine/lysine/ornithine decarboxylase